MRIAIHPGMTAEQIARWCRTHKMVATIRWAHSDFGTVPYITAEREVEPDASLPDYLRGHLINDEVMP